MIDVPLIPHASIQTMDPRTWQMPDLSRPPPPLPDFSTPPPTIQFNYPPPPPHFYRPPPQNFVRFNGMPLPTPLMPSISFMGFPFPPPPPMPSVPLPSGAECQNSIASTVSNFFSASCDVSKKLKQVCEKII